MAPYDSAPVDHSLELHELHYQLILNHSDTQKVIFNPSGGVCKFGHGAVNDWALEDPCQAGKKIVARAKGLHIQATDTGGESWHNSFDMVFGDGSGLEGSTLQVMGSNIYDGQWSIVGGTGKLSMARGVIYKTPAGPNKAKLEIHAFYIPMIRKQDAHSSGEKNVWRW
uniref:Uncharacterized protein n=1 Tax=Avena sativa TaxID=4498 RepID=A0ACD6A4A1_AVESA